MSSIVLIALTAGSAISTIGGLIVSGLTRRIRDSEKAAPTERYTLTIESGGREKIYRIESHTKQGAEEMIRDLIESSES